jgi:predicted membrane protein
VTQNSDRAGVQEIWSTPAPRTETRPVPPAPRRRWWRTPWAAALLAVVVFNLLYALPRYLKFEPSQARIVLDPGFRLHFQVLVAHVITGNIAMVTLFLQLIPWIRRHHPRVHRASGTVYLFAGVLPGALLALVLLPYSLAPTGRVGLATMSVLWIGTSLTGYRMQRLHRYADHRRWMYYSAALALGTSWGRILGELMMHVPGFHIDLMIFLEISSWLGWITNLLIAQWWLERTSRRV